MIGGIAANNASGMCCGTAQNSHQTLAGMRLVLADRVRHKFRMKNTTGYGLNALLNDSDPADVLSHLMTGSEGTLGLISEITYFTVEEQAHKASALLLFDHLESACSAVRLLKRRPVVAVQLLDRAAMRAVQDQPGMPDALRDLPADAAALLVKNARGHGCGAGCQDRPTPTPSSTAMPSKATWTSASRRTSARRPSRNARRG